jgi:hypothetical protein
MYYNATTNEIWYGATNTTQASQGTKTFVIPHPHDPERYLVHACLEGPEAGVYYRGKGTLKNGTDECSIQLPEYTNVFSNFTVHVTCIGKPVLLGVSDVVNGSFTVYSEHIVIRDTFFNWVVYGMRLPIEVEPLKSESVVFGEGPYCWISNSLEKERM